MKTPQDVFETIYIRELWGKGKGSGPGSDPEFVKPYVDFLQSFIKERGIKSVVDIGSGDWQFSKDIDWGDTRYTGYDCTYLARMNQEKYGSSNVQFIQLDVINNYLEVQPCDLMIIKDVLQHWDNKTVLKVTYHLLKKCRYALITNCCDQTIETLDISLGRFRPLNRKFFPLSLFNPALVLEFGGKHTYLVRGELP